MTPNRPTAFTLLELVLVLGIMALLMAAAAPSLRGWSRGTKIHDAAERVLAATRYARTQAVNSATTHRFEIDPEGLRHRVTVLEGQMYVPVPGEFGHEQLLPSGVRIQLLRNDGAGEAAVAFEANGRVTPAT